MQFSLSLRWHLRRNNYNATAWISGVITARVITPEHRRAGVHKELLQSLDAFEIWNANQNWNKHIVFFVHRGKEQSACQRHVFAALTFQCMRGGRGGMQRDSIRNLKIPFQGFLIILIYIFNTSLLKLERIQYLLPFFFLMFPQTCNCEYNWKLYHGVSMS